MARSARLDNALLNGLCSSKNPRYTSAIEVVNSHSCGDIYLTGKNLQENIFYYLYGKPEVRPAAMYFFVSGFNSLSVPIPDGWVLNSHANDVRVFLRGRDELALRLLHFKGISHFLKTRALTIDSLAWDVQKQTLIGDTGIMAMDAEKIEVHNPDAARNLTKALNLTSTEELIDRRKRQLFPSQY